MKNLLNRYREVFFLAGIVLAVVTIGSLRTWYAQPTEHYSYEQRRDAKEPSASKYVKVALKAKQECTTSANVRLIQAHATPAEERAARRYIERMRRATPGANRENYEALRDAAELCETITKRARSR